MFVYIITISYTRTGMYTFYCFIGAVLRALYLVCQGFLGGFLGGAK